MAMTNNTTTRRTLLKGSAAIATLAAATSLPGAKGEVAAKPQPAGLLPLTPPAGGVIPVAFPISDGAVLIDFTGPWEVFRSATLVRSDGSMDMSDAGGFRTYTVAERKTTIESSGGMKILPDYTFADAPAPKVIVIPAQGGGSEAMLGWIRDAAKTADMTMSVCTGAFVLAKTGLLSGKAATTHHGAYVDLAMQYPDIRVKRGFRFVDEGNIASAGGLTCGIDLAMHVLERYYGRDSALQTALQLEYQGKGWMDASGADNAYYAKPLAGLVCPVCGMAVDTHSSLKSDFNGRTYYFCTTSHKVLFDKSPQAILDLVAHV
jgi:putative intracellular protease/amidase/YHS domain-containing protein